MTIEQRGSAIIKAENVRIGSVVKIGARDKNTSSTFSVVLARFDSSKTRRACLESLPDLDSGVAALPRMTTAKLEIKPLVKIEDAQFIPRAERPESTKTQVNVEMLRGINEYKKAAQVFAPKVDDVVEAQWKLRYVEQEPIWILKLLKMLAKKLGLTKIWQWFIKPLVAKNISEPIYIRILSGQYQASH